MRRDAGGISQPDRDRGVYACYLSWPHENGRARSWQISEDRWPEALGVALWFRAAERIDVPAGAEHVGMPEITLDAWVRGHQGAEALVGDAGCRGEGGGERARRGSGPALPGPAGPPGSCP